MFGRCFLRHIDFVGALLNTRTVEFGIDALVTPFLTAITPWQCGVKGFNQVAQSQSHQRGIVGGYEEYRYELTKANTL